MYFTTNDILLALRKHSKAKIIIEIMTVVDYEGGQTDYAHFDSEEELVEFLKTSTELQFAHLPKHKPKITLLQGSTLEFAFQDKTTTLSFFEAQHCSRVYELLTDS